MRRTTYSLLALAALTSSLFIYCGGNPPAEGTANSGEDSLNNVNAAQRPANLEDDAAKMDAMLVALKQLPKLSDTDLQAFFPAEINGWERTAYSGSDQAYGVNVSSGSAVYDADDKELMLNLTDGAGETGAAIVSLAAMRLNMDAEKDTPYDISKNENVHGFRVSTRETKPQEAGNVIDSDINFVYKERYLIKLEGDGFSLDELKDVVGKLDYSKLK